MTTINSNIFSITANRFTTTINSNIFSITANRFTEVQIGTDGKTSEIIVYKGITLLSPVNDTPTVGQYKVSLSCTGCVAKLKEDNKTIYVESVSSSSANIVASINVENVRTYIKNIAIEKIINEGEVSIIKGSLSTVKQTADKIHWLVKSGTSSSDMTLTDDAYNLISNNVHITAKNIKLEGYTTINNNFSIDTNGNMNCYNANISGTITGSTISGTEVTGGSFNVEGQLTAKKIVCDEIDSPKYPSAIIEDLNFYISTTGDNDNELENEAIFETFESLLEKLPKNLNGHTVNIQTSNNVNENIRFVGFHSGKINIYMNGHTLYGYINSQMSDANIFLYSGTIGNGTSTNNGNGKIHPSVGYAIENYTTTVSIENSGNITLYNIDVYGADNYLNGSNDKVGLASSNWGTIHSNNVAFYGCDIGCMTNIGGRIHDSGSSKICAKYGFEAITGGYITLAGSTHAGGVTANYHESDAGKVIIANNATFEGGSSEIPTPIPTPTPEPAPTPKTTKTVTIKSINGDTYRSTKYYNWKDDNSVRQGNYGFGNCNGYWFFGDQFAQFKNKNINKVAITITRQDGGIHNSVDLSIRTHNYTKRPSNSPDYIANVGILGLKTNTTAIKIISDTTNALITGMKAGTIKGIGIKSTYDSAHYAVCSGSCSLKITYTE